MAQTKSTAAASDLPDIDFSAPDPAVWSETGRREKTALRALLNCSDTTAVAEMYGVPEAAVVRRALALKLGHSLVKWSDAQLALTAKMFKDGYSDAEIATALGRSRCAVTSRRQKDGVTQPVGRPPQSHAASHRPRLRAPAKMIDTDKPGTPPVQMFEDITRDESRAVRARAGNPLDVKPPSPEPVVPLTASSAAMACDTAPGHE